MDCRLHGKFHKMEINMILKEYNGLGVDIVDEIVRFEPYGSYYIGRLANTTNALS